MDKKKAKEIDAVALKRKIQADMHQETKRMTQDQKRAFYSREASSGTLAKFWKSVQAKGKGSKKAAG